MSSALSFPASLAEQGEGRESIRPRLVSVFTKWIPFPSRLPPDFVITLDGASPRGRGSAGNDKGLIGKPHDLSPNQTRVFDLNRFGRSARCLRQEHDHATESVRGSLSRRNGFQSW